MEVTDLLPSSPPRVSDAGRWSSTPSVSQRGVLLPLLRRISDAGSSGAAPTQAAPTKPLSANASGVGRWSSIAASSPANVSVIFFPCFDYIYAQKLPSNARPLPGLNRSMQPSSPLLHPMNITPDTLISISSVFCVFLALPIPTQSLNHKLQTLASHQPLQSSNRKWLWNSSSTSLRPSSVLRRYAFQSPSRSLPMLPQLHPPLPIHSSLLCFINKC